MSNTPSVLFIGCGKMGGAILEGLLKQGLSCEKIFVSEPNEEIRTKLAKKGIKTASCLKEFENLTPEIVFLAVKPFLIESIIQEVKPFTDKGACVVSIIAGRKIEWFKEQLGQNVCVFRTMPNTPACVGKGISGIFPCGLETILQKQSVETLFSACGEVLWLEKEAEIDAITAVSGSGPAYLFYFTEALALAAQNLGFSEQTALKLAKATVIGSSELMNQSENSPSVLRQNVTTPNGTTAAALDILMNPETGFEPSLKKALKSAEKRSQELSKV